MRIVIDMQGAQTGNRYRGIGRYTMAFAKAMVHNRGEHEIILVLSGLFPETIEPIRAAFDGLLPQENIRVWHAPGPVMEAQSGNDTRREVAELIREAFLASLKPDVIHICSLFEGFADDAITSIGRFDAATPVSVTLYDLIPLLNPEHYLKPNRSHEQYYLRKIEHLRRARLWLAISESSRREGIAHLNLPEAWVLNVGTDADSRFKPLQIPPEEEQRLRQEYGLSRPFVMYTGGIDHRKNIEGLICAYAKLPQQLRRVHQLAIVCSVQPEQKTMLERLALDRGLDHGELVLTGFVPDEDLLALYNLCALFVFPSWHEGFGLPVLEAMRCGAPVIGANTTSIPEIIGWEDSLFDPHSQDAMAAAIRRGLTDEEFRDKLIQNGKIQAECFSWGETARRAIDAMERFHLENQVRTTHKLRHQHRPKLAYISPLPPERSGIADYSAELLPELAKFYEIEVVVDQADLRDYWIKEHCPIRSLNWFKENHHQFDRVVYHFGNSHFHQHMFPLLENIPGIVVLHDFFLSGIQMWRDAQGWCPQAWSQSLYFSHGYSALNDRYSANTSEVVERYPANLTVLQRAFGVILHSDHSQKLAMQWYGSEAAVDWRVIPLLRAPAEPANREEIRLKLGFERNDLLICSFGFLAPTKLNHRLLQAFLASPLTGNTKVQLVFVGENHCGEYGQDLLQTINGSQHTKRIRITGWTDNQTYRAYLAAADIAVQLRTLTRGETSASVLDCMNYGLPTIVNAHGSMADLDENGVWLLPDDFDDEDLASALTTLANDSELRHQLGARAQNIVHTKHAPQACAQMYFEAIEQSYAHAQYGLQGLMSKIASNRLHEHDLASLAACLAENYPPSPRKRQLLVDITDLLQRDVGTAIQRVVRNILKVWLNNPPEGYRVEPVYAIGDSLGYRYARRFTSRFLGIPEDWAQDEPAEAWANDVFIGLDLQLHVVPAQQTTLHKWRNRGVKVWFLIYDLLPILMPQFFLPEAQSYHQRWLESISQFDGVVCISRAVADEMREWLAAHEPHRERPLAIEWFHLGADVDDSAPTRGLPDDAPILLNALNARHSFLMVGTVEPRKGHVQVLDAFDLLWKSGMDFNLVIVGKQGWMVESLIERLRSHPELDKRLFWLEGISDEYLEKVYAASTCLIAASYGEGFGLPLIEAAQHKIPIIARDIPVFREVAGAHALYFDGLSPDHLSQVVKEFLYLRAINQAPSTEGMHWLTWEQSADQLKLALLNNHQTQTNQTMT